MKIALAQMDSQTYVPTNLKKMEAMIRQARADLIVFPECVDYCGNDWLHHQDDGTILSQFCLWAEKYHIYLYAGSIVTRKGTNTSVLISNEGKVIGRYSKLHMFDVALEDLSYKESDTITKGNEIVLCQTQLGTIGMSICYDIRFAEMYRLMALAGAQIIVVVANFTKQTGSIHWKPLLQARAIENNCFVVACGQVGKKETLQMEAYGHSMIIDPWGRVLLEMDDQQQVQTCDIDLSVIESVRRQIPSMQNRRTDVYQLHSSDIHIYKESR